MSRLFLRLVSMSIAAGWLVLAVLALRAALHRSPRRILCLLWVLVAVRLVCPLSIESRVSVVPRQETVVQSVQQILDAEPTDTSPTPTERTSVVSALSRVWLAGLSAMLLWALWGDLRLRRRVRVSLPQGERIRVCDEINTPFVLGLLRPRIYLPSRLDPAQAVYVIAHENAHIARLDHWWKPLGWLLLSVYWFHPLLWLAYVLFCRDLELACDERVAEQLDRGGLAAYSEALLHCSRVRRGDMVFPVAFGEVGVKTRVKAILRYHRPGRRLVAASLAAVVAVGVLFLTDRPVLAAQLQELLPAADEAAWTIPLAGCVPRAVGDAGALTVAARRQCSPDGADRADVCVSRSAANHGIDAECTAGDVGSRADPASRAGHRRRYCGFRRLLTKKERAE